MYQVAFYKRILSYFIPVRIRQGSSEENPSLELFLYRGGYQLATPDAVYSDGTRYRPLVAAFKELEKQLPDINSVLLLGTGLGSAVQILARKGFYPAFTLIEKDSTILGWAAELLKQSGRHKNIEPIYADAAVYMETNNRLYDLVIVDIFNGRVVPGFVTDIEFLKQCRRSMNPGGNLVLNYIVNNERDWDSTLSRFSTVFSGYDMLSFGINRIIIATA